jgi:hypothetical protein
LGARTAAASGVDTTTASRSVTRRPTDMSPAYPTSRGAAAATSAGRAIRGGCPQPSISMAATVRAWQSGCQGSRPCERPPRGRA